MKFPNNFFWGAAASAIQTEGASDQRGVTTWDKWFELEPELFENNIGPIHTSNVFELYKEDIQIMKEMKLNSYRTSISWARLIPDGKTINPEAIAFYRSYFKNLKDNGIEPIINLFHFDMPWWMMEKGGWENPEIIDYFSFYAATAFTNFSDIVTYWTTFNEPMVHIECGYLGTAHWPKIFDFKRAIQVAYHTLMSHFAAVKTFKDLAIKGKIGIILNLSPIYSRSTQYDDVHAQKMADLIYIRSLLDPIINHIFPPELVDLFTTHNLLPKIIPNHTKFLSQSIDFLGVNYYQPLRVKAPTVKKKTPSHPNFWYSSYDWPQKKINPHRGWEIYEKGIYDIAMRIKNSYKNIPWFISENGMGVSQEERFINEAGIVQDTYRIEFIHNHLSYLHSAIQDGSNCFGYHLWTFIDCWSWLNGYKNRYGLCRVDIDNNFKRSRKLSSYWMEKVIEKNELININFDLNLPY